MLLGSVMARGAAEAKGHDIGSFPKPVAAQTYSSQRSRTSSRTMTSSTRSNATQSTKRSTQSHANRSFILMVIGSVSVFVIGLIMAIIVLFIASHFNDLIEILDVDFQDRTWASKGLKLTVVIAIAGSTCLILLGAIGYIGYQKQSRRMVCTFMIGTIIFSTFFFGLSIAGLEWDTVVEPMVEKQALQFCESNLYMMFSASNNCHEKYESIPKSFHAECDEHCQRGMVVIREMGGCDVLDTLCHAWVYDEQSTCSSDSFNVAHAHVVERDCCTQSCNRRINCSAYVHDPTSDECFLLAAQSLGAGNSTFGGSDDSTHQEGPHHGEHQEESHRGKSHEEAATEHTSALSNQSAMSGVAPQESHHGSSDEELATVHSSAQSGSEHDSAESGVSNQETAAEQTLAHSGSEHKSAEGGVSSNRSEAHSHVEGGISGAAPEHVDAAVHNQSNEEDRTEHDIEQRSVSAVDPDNGNLANTSDGQRRLKSEHSVGSPGIRQNPTLTRASASTNFLARRVAEEVGEPHEHAHHEQTTEAGDHEEGEQHEGESQESEGASRRELKCAIDTPTMLNVGAWPFANGRDGITCDRKRKPQIIQDSYVIALGMSICSVITAIILASASICGCMFQYTLVKKWKYDGRPRTIASKMCCPCCS